LTIQSQAQFGSKWFCFTSTTSTQWIHTGFGTLKGLNIRLYDKSYGPIGSQIYLFIGENYSKLSDSISLNDWQIYYIKTTPYSNDAGTFRIAVNTSNVVPQ
jgi:hypothetical protein